MKTLVFIFIFIGVSLSSFGQLQNNLKNITKDKDALIGISIYDFSSKKMINIHGNKMFPMQSVYKFPIALATLHLVDIDSLSLNKEIMITKRDLLPDTWSPIRDKYPDGTTMTLADILSYTVSLSDNNGCDILINLLGGTQTINKYIQKLGIDNIHITKTEAQQHREWNFMYENSSSPKAAIKLLRLFDSQQIISTDSYHFLWNIMSETSTGSITTKLPDSVIVAHKTGSSPLLEGIYEATNDIGIMVLPNGKRIAFAIFIFHSKETKDTNYAVISDIAKTIYDYYR